MTRDVTEAVVKELYPNCFRGEYSRCVHDYQPIIAFIGTVALQSDDDEYQGGHVATHIGLKQVPVLVIVRRSDTEQRIK